MTSTEASRTPPTTTQVAAAAGGGAALMVLLAVAVTGRSGFGPQSSWHVLYSGSTAVQATGAIVAVLVSTWSLPTIARSATTVLGLSIATIAILTSDSLGAGFIASIGAGLALGCLAARSVTPADRRSVIALIIGAICGVTVYRGLRPIAFNAVGDRFETTAVVLIGLTTVMAGALLVEAIASARSRSDGAAPVTPAWTSDRRVAAGGIALVVVAVVTDWAFTASVMKSQSTDVWWWGWLPVVAMIITGLALRRVGGAIVVVAAAWAVSKVGEITWAPKHSVWLLLAVVLVVAASVVGYRVRRPVLGVVVLAFCAATYLVYGSPLGDIYSMTTVFVAPAAAAFAVMGVIAENPPSAPLTVTALSGPAIWVIAPQLVFVVFAGSAGDERTFNSSFGPQTMSAAAERAIPMVIAITACAIALAVIVRRQRASH